VARGYLGVKRDRESALLDRDAVDYPIDDAPVLDAVSTAAASTVSTPVVTSLVDCRWLYRRDPRRLAQLNRHENLLDIGRRCDHREFVTGI
jgi:hypothetical protein